MHGRDLSLLFVVTKQEGSREYDLKKETWIEGVKVRPPVKHTFQWGERTYCVTILNEHRSLKLKSTSSAGGLSSVCFQIIVNVLNILWLLVYLNKPLFCNRKQDCNCVIILIKCACVWLLRCYVLSLFLVL